MAKSGLKVGFNTFLDEKVSRLNKNHKLGICLAAIVVPVVAFYFSFYSSKQIEIENLEDGISKLQKELKIVKAKAARLDEHMALKKEVELKFKEASIVIPDKQEIPNLLTSISSEGTGSGLDILSFIPGAESPKEFYAEIPVTLSVHGTYHNLGYFLDKVSKLPRIVNVGSVTLGSPSMADGEMLLNAGVNLVTYKFIEPVEGAQQ